MNDPYDGASLPGFNAITPGRAQMANVADTKAFGGTMVNEFRLHFMRLATFQNEPAGGTGVTLSSPGFVTGTNTLGIVPLDTATEGVPQTSFNNYSIGVPGFSQRSITTLID